MDFEPLVDVSCANGVAEAFVNSSYRLISEIEVGGLTSHLYVARNNPLEIRDSLAEELHEDVIKGLLICQQIDRRCQTSFTLLIISKNVGFMATDGRVGPSFLEDSREARCAGVLHEAIHGLQEEMGVVGWNDNEEALPNLAEFLFTRGGIRLGMFRGLYDRSFDSQTSNHYALAMRDIRQILGDSSSEPSDDGYREMRKKVVAMSEQEKINIIRGAINSISSTVEK